MHIKRGIRYNAKRQREMCLTFLIIGTSAKCRCTLQSGT